MKTGKFADLVGILERLLPNFFLNILGLKDFKANNLYFILYRRYNDSH